MPSDAQSTGGYNRATPAQLAQVKRILTQMAKAQAAGKPMPDNLDNNTARYDKADEGIYRPAITKYRTT